MLDFIADEIALLQPERLNAESAWMEHTPFAFAIVKCHKPSVLVELGTQSGVSYCAFCQAVSVSNISCKCYAVDTWEGDEHSGFYGTAVFEELSGYHGRKYSHFSQLLKMSFDAALGYFSDGSIDLLHIDGCHVYEAVKHDFESWLPKMSSRGVVLFHDTSVRDRGFGVWRLFEELKLQYESFEFLHGSGLGIIAVGTALRDEPLGELFRAEKNQAILVKQFCEALGERVLLHHRVAELERLCVQKDSQLFKEHSQLEEIVNSRLWRIVAPLRWGATKMRRIRDVLNS